MNKVKCCHCKYYCRVVNHLGKTIGRVCSLWLDGIVDSEGWYPSENCFEGRSRKITNKEIYELVELIKNKKKE